MSVVVIDNYDSFAYNLVQLLGSLGADPVVVRNDALTVDELEAMAPERVVVSPGPGTPSTAGVSVEAFRRLGPGGTPMLGVCLGHQSLGEAFGGRTVRATRVMHGKTGPVRHTGEGIFEGLPTPFDVVRYHSLVTDAAALPAALEPMAWSEDPGDWDEVQAMRHRELPLWGVQFHPESCFGRCGREVVEGFLRI